MTSCVAPGCSSVVQPGPFCELHAKAPAGQRGGWLSAAKRRPYDANAVAPRLWVGAAPPLDRDLPQVDLLVLCAIELQPEALAFRGQVLRCPIPDSKLEVPQVTMAMITSVSVARAVSQGQRALVTCAAGFNRSSLVAALALGQLTTMDGGAIVAHIRKHRGDRALRNPHFESLIRSVVSDGRPKATRRSRRSADSAE